MSLNKLSVSNSRYGNYFAIRSVTTEQGVRHESLKDEQCENITRGDKLKRKNIKWFFGRVRNSKLDGEKKLDEQIGLPKNQKFLQKISISLANCSGLTQAHVNELAEFVRKHAGSLTEMELDFSDIDSDIRPERIIEEIKHLSELRGLKIKLADSFFMRDEKSIKDIARALRYPKKLHTLELDYSDIVNAYRLPFKPILQTLIKIHKLQKLKINLSGVDSFFNVQGVDEIAGALRYLNKLHSLELDFSRVTPFGNNITLTSLIDSLKNLRLENFKIDLRGTSLVIDEAAIADLGRMLQSQINMRRLEMNFSGTSGGRKLTLDPISLGLSRLSEIEHISIGLAETGFLDEDAGLGRLGKILCGQKNLKSLEIGVSQSQSNGAALSNFINSLRNLEKLEGITLNLDRSAWLAKQGKDAAHKMLKEVWFNLDQLKSLRVFNLKVHQSWQLDDNEIHRVRALMDGLKELKEINLDVCGAQCTAASLKTLTKNMRDDQTLRLIIFDKDPMNDKEIQKIIGHFKHGGKARVQVEFAPFDFSR